MAKVQYVGNKPFAIDNVAGSGVVWEGKGDIKTVTDRQARALIRYPDQWELTEDSDPVAVAKEPVTRFIDPDGERVEIAESDLNKPLEKLGRNELRAYALQHYQKSLPAKMGRTEMVNAIEELQRGMDPFKQI